MDRIKEVLERGTAKIYPSKEKLEKILRSGKKLRIYQGFDPTGTQLHIGHLVGLNKLRQFQQLGHEIIFLIGDGTGQAGDPSGKLRSREKYLTKKQLRLNAKDYVMQAGKIIDFTGKNAAKILYNSDWLNKLNLVEILNIANHFSLQQLEERDLFVERKKRGEEIPLREFLYPLLQGYDSVAMRVDLEIGGEDQTFNMLCGRKLVKELLKKEKFVLTTPLLTDSCGRKIGKTEGNIIALNALPNDFYAMIMNLPDDVIITCFYLITDTPIHKIDEYKNKLKKGESPMIYKKKLAFSLTKMLNGEKSALEAQDYFEKTFQKKILPTDLAPIFISSSKIKNIIDLLFFTKLVASRSQAKRLIKEEAIELNGKKIRNFDLTSITDNNLIIKIGKHRFYKVILN